MSEESEGYRPSEEEVQTEQIPVNETKETKPQVKLVERVTENFGIVERYKYDDQGRLIEKIEKTGGDTTAMIITEVENYDQRGNVIVWTCHKSRGAGQFAKPAYAYRHIYDYEYDEQGRIVKKTISSGDPDSRSPYSELKRERSTTDEMEYDENGNLTKVVHKESNGKVRKVTEYEYDRQGRKTRMLYSDLLEPSSFSNGSIKNYEYDEAGNLIKITSGNKIRGETYGSVKMEYDEKGRMIRRESNEKDDSWEYDEQGRIARHTFRDKLKDKEGFSVDYEYDEHGNCIRIGGIKYRLRYEKV